MRGAPEPGPAGHLGAFVASGLATAPRPEGARLTGTPPERLPYLAWAIHEGHGVYRYGGRTRKPLGRLRLVDGWARPLDQEGDPSSDVYLTVSLAVRKAWREGDGSYPERVRVDDLRYRVTPPPQAKPRPEVVRSGRLRRPETKPMSLREIAEREAPGWKRSRD